MYHVFIKEMCYLKKVCVYVVCVGRGVRSVLAKKPKIKCLFKVFVVTFINKMYIHVYTDGRRDLGATDMQFFTFYILVNFQ